jgi:hypothetical protein
MIITGNEGEAHKRKGNYNVPSSTSLSIIFPFINSLKEIKQVARSNEILNINIIQYNHYITCNMLFQFS